MWNYIFYKAYLSFKDRMDFNGNEKYIYDRMLINDISWLPIKKYNYKH